MAEKYLHLYVNGYAVSTTALLDMDNYITSTDESAILNRLKCDLSESKNNFIRLFNSSIIPQWIYATSSLKLLIANEAAIKQYGYTGEEFSQMTILQMAPEDDNKKVILFNEFLKTTNTHFTVVGFHLKKNGESIAVETTYINLQYEQQACVLVSSMDITDKIRNEEKILLAKLTRQRKITRLAINGQEFERDYIWRELHDSIIQQLAASKMYLGISKANGEIKLDFLNKAENILLNVIIETRSLANSLIPATLKIINFTSSLKNLIAIYRTSHTFEIILDCEENLNGLGEEFQTSLYRIIQEHLNAILSKGNVKIVKIKLWIEDQIQLLMEDDGIDLEDSGIYPGAGIANIRNRVGLYNGTVKINSQPKEGSYLLVSIPNDSQVAHQKQIKIILVEDDKDDSELILRAFAMVAPNCELTCLTDGRMLVDLLPTFKAADLPSLIVLDYNMPLLNGLETLKILELDNRFNKIPKIIYSSSDQNNIKNLCFTANAKGYITKGITMEEIKDNVHEILSFLL
jgi:PAS domain S-box-containing protein